MTEASRTDVRVSLLEVSVATTTYSPGWQYCGGDGAHAFHIVRHQDREQLDDVNARDVFLKRIPMLKSCPHS